jgi:hypothetical protein
VDVIYTIVNGNYERPTLFELESFALPPRGNGHTFARAGGLCWGILSGCGKRRGGGGILGGWGYLKLGPKLKISCFGKSEPGEVFIRGRIRRYSKAEI